MDNLNRLCIITLCFLQILVWDTNNYVSGSPLYLPELEYDYDGDEYKDEYYEEEEFVPFVGAISSMHTSCNNSSITLQLDFIDSFWGFIYIETQQCILHEGYGSRNLIVVIPEGTCGYEAKSKLTWFHIQWDPSISQESDFRFPLLCKEEPQQQPSLDIPWTTVAQPSAVMLLVKQNETLQWSFNPSRIFVYVNETLSVYFVVKDDHVAPRDIVVRQCSAKPGHPSRSSVVSDGLKLIRDECSIYPTVISDVTDVRELYQAHDGKNLVVKSAHLKPFNLTTGEKDVFLQCEIEICYDACSEVKPCHETMSSQYHRRRTRDLFESVRTSYFIETVCSYSLYTV